MKNKRPRQRHPLWRPKVGGTQWPRRGLYLASPRQERSQTFGSFLKAPAGDRKSDPESGQETTSTGSHIKYMASLKKGLAHDEKQYEPRARCEFPQRPPADVDFAPDHPPNTQCVDKNPHLPGAISKYGAMIQKGLACGEKY